MQKLVVLEFPDDWKKGQCEKCPLHKMNGDTIECFIGKIRKGWCTLQIKSDNCIENAYNKGYKEGMRKEFR